MCDKLCLTQSEARRIIHQAKKRQTDKKGNNRKPNKKVPYREYWCDECCAYHVTKSRNPDYYSDFEPRKFDEHRK